MRMNCFIIYSLIPVWFVASENEMSSSVLQSCHERLQSCNSQVKGNDCNCDRLCLYYDDCCYDAHEISKVRTDVGQSPVPFLRETSCEFTSFKEKRPSLQGAFMVSACPTSWKGDMGVKFKCEYDIDRDVLDYLPVFDITTGITFKNRQCALCHNVHVHGLIPWLLKLRCSNEFYKYDIQSAPLSLKDAMMLRLKSLYCEYLFEPSKYIRARYCYHNVEYLLWNVLKEVNSTSCNNRILKPFWIQNKNKTKIMFRNSHCLIDNYDVSNSSYTHLVLCYVERNKDNGINIRDTTISSLIDISALFDTHESAIYCSKTEIHLSDKIGCLTLHCPTDMEPAGGKCVALKYNSYDIMLDLLFEINMPVTLGNTYFVIFESLTEKLGNKLKIISSSGETIMMQTTETKIIPGYHVTSMKPCSLIRFQRLLKGYPISKVSSEYIIFLVTNLFAHYHQNISNGVYVKHLNDVEESLCEHNTSLRNPMYVANRLSHGDIAPCPAVKVYPYRNYSDSNYSHCSLLNGKIHSKVFYLNCTIIESEDVLFKQGSYFLCVDTYLSKYQVENENDVSMNYYRYVINTICTCLSIISLVYSLAQYCVIPLMREGKSELLFVLMLYLLFAQSLFLMMSHIKVKQNLCEWLGMIHHFVWIGTFTFMFLCSFRLNSEIRNLTTISRSERCSRTVTYGCVGFVLDISSVLSTKILNSVLAPSQTWYGGNICFISHVNVLLLAFVLPISLFLCGNITLFILIIHYVKATSLQKNNSSNQSTIFVLIKISSIMGFSWIIGIIATFVQSEILLIIFENISSLQGMFITLSISCNNRVHKFYSDLCSQKQKTHSTGPTTVHSD